MNTISRPVAQSLFPDMRADQATGPLLTSVATGSNADLIASIAPLHLTGRVLDVTYGRGMWWTRYRPADLTCHDRDTLDGVDFRHLPHADESFDAVCFDPPYIPHHSPATSTARDFIDRFGTGRGATTPTELFELFDAGLTECERVCKRGGGAAREVQRLL
ncbi:MAG: hypothetical protein Q7V57_11185 [Actinomycetota bacterium]|nr:hypothetical protein [Actinomycetota bacterium]